MFFLVFLALGPLLEILDAPSLAELVLAPKFLPDESLKEEDGEVDQDTQEEVNDVSPALANEGNSITYTHRVANHDTRQHNDAEFVVNLDPVAQV